MSLSVSVVSHGHATQVLNLLGLMARAQPCVVRQVWLTVNRPEPELASAMEALAPQWPFAVHVLHNAAPKGFSANHNQAFQHDQAGNSPSLFFAVVNPDLSWSADPFPAMLAAVRSPGVGCVYPLQHQNNGEIQDHRRRLPTPFSLLRRHLCAGAAPAATDRMDWVNAAFMLFPSSVYAALAGFDESYHMYCEDVDLCLRLQLSGWHLQEVPQSVVVHEAQRNSRKQWKHFVWHVSSLMRLWQSDAYRRFQAGRQAKA